MTEIKCTYNTLASTISNIEEPGTYGLKITDPTSIQIKAVTATNSLGYILANNIVDGVYFDLTYTDLTKAKLSSLDFAFKGCSNITRIGAFPDNLLTTGEGTFQDCTALITADIDSYDNVIDASYLFKNCTSLKYVSTNRLTKVTEADEMFAGCTALESMDICMMGVVTVAERMFQNCTSLETLILSKQFVIDLKSDKDMLIGCTALKNIKQVDPAIIDRSTTINGNMELNGKLVVSDASEKKGAVIHGEIDTDCIHAKEHIEAPEVNVSTMNIGGAELTSNSDNLFLNGSPILTQSDGISAVEEDSLLWQGQLKLGKIEAGKRIILITKVDNTHASTLSGQILFYGPDQILGTYHIDLSGTGKRSFVGASSGEQANIIYCDYNNEKYFALQFPGTAEGNVFFIGWKNAGQMFMPPAYSKYTDSEILVLASYGYSVSSELTTSGLTVKPYESAPAMMGCVPFGSINGNKILLLIKKSTAYTCSIGGQLFEYGNGINSMYHFSVSTSGSRFINGSSSYEEKASLVQVTYENETYYGINFPSGKNAQLLFQGFDNRVQMVKPPSSYKDSDFTIVSDITNEGKDVGEAIEVPSATNIDASFKTASPALATLATHEVVYEGLKIMGEVPTQLFSSGTAGNETGYLYISGACRAIAFNVAGPCTIAYSFTVPEDGTTTNNTVTITDTLVNYDTLDAKDVRVSHSFKYQDLNPRTLYLVTSKAINLNYLSVTYTAETVTNLGANIIANLPETGTDTYHVVKLNGSLTKAALLNIAQQLRESDKQIYLDMEDCTVTEDANQWTDGAGLKTLFANCTGLRGIKVPQGVTIISGHMFYSCISLRELVLPEGLKKIGSNNESSLAGLLAATPLTDLEIPASVSVLDTGFLTNSNIKTLVFKSPNAAIRENTQLFSYHCFSNSQSKLKLYMNQDLYNYLTSNNKWWTSADNCGTDVLNRIIIQ